MENVLGASVTSNFTQIITSGNLIHFNGNIYLSDIFDILLIAIFLYSVFLLFKRTRTYLILIGLVIILALYAFAKLFNLYLTSIALQYFFSVFVVVFAIIFQSEIRKFFEWLGLVGTRRINVSPLTPHLTTAEIIQACVKMAQARIGALIVIQGKDDLRLITEGGVSLDGAISEEILLSIFDPHSEGHDGALVIFHNRISQFGVHLPLSNNFKEIGKHGTRHSAGLGLSENSDALAIIVSEEKGTISISRDGRLKKLENFSDLEKELDKFTRDKFTGKQESLLAQIIKKDLSLKSAALASAGVFWFFSAYQAGNVKKTYTVPVNFEKLPPSTLVETYSPKTVTVTVSGRGELAFSGTNPENFEISLDASNLKNGVNKFDLSSKNIQVPLNLSITSIDPENILLTAKKYSTVKTGVAVKTKGQPAKGFKVSSITVTPEVLDLWVPESATPPGEIATDLIDLTNQKDSFVVPISLNIPPEDKLVKPDTPTANVAITIEKQ